MRQKLSRYIPGASITNIGTEIVTCFLSVGRERDDKETDEEEEKA